ncbi:hypothetical protein [Actinotalea subterranea]|uniref:hypothetical protein n=1 Tax=Actinotalea subterranea TaxID=2607497 RepID=UPI00165E05E3|nr:hypothetical protein [Actinotalea subterranea]
MAVLADVIEALGLRAEMIGPAAEVMVGAADAAMASVEPQTGEAADFVATHALRGMGLLALVDQTAAQEFAVRAARWLAHARHPGWPLALAVQNHRALTETRFPEWAELTGYPADLLQLAIGDVKRGLGPDDAADVAYSRAGLAPYRIDLRLLAAIVRGGNGVEIGYVSEPSAPAVVGAFLGSIEDALDVARVDARRWATGLGPVAGTDPEILLALHALRRSPASWAAGSTPDEYPQVNAALRLVERLDAS